MKTTKTKIEEVARFQKAITTVTLTSHTVAVRMDATEAIRLPTGSPFVLIKANTHLCQKVDGMVEKSQYFYWDTEDDNPRARVSGPINAELSSNSKRNIKVHYCYYA